MELDLCFGEFCPIRLKCLRYKKDIDVRKQNHLAVTPYNHEKNKCGFFVGKDGDGLLSTIFNKKKDK